MMRGILELFVLIMDTTAWLSQEKRTCLLRQEGPDGTS